MEKASGCNVEKIWFHKIGEEGINSFVKRTFKKSLLVIMIEQEHFYTFTKSGIVRGGN